MIATIAYQNSYLKYDDICIEEYTYCYIRIKFKLGITYYTMTNSNKSIKMNILKYEYINKIRSRNNNNKVVYGMSIAFV